MSDVLDKICADKREHIAACKTEIPLDNMKSRASDGPPPRGFEAALVQASTNGSYGLIAELKKASPSKGLIRKNFAPSTIARAYETGGATCLSVLTDTPYFQGKNDYLTAARMATNLPILRKDFMIDPYQINEARASGGDCILLIMAVLEDSIALELEGLAVELGMDVLVEVHNKEELDRALALESGLIGINNRNLASFKTDLRTTELLLKQFEVQLKTKGSLVVSESGLFTRAHLNRVFVAGAQAVLVGESLMRQDDIRSAMRKESYFMQLGVYLNLGGRLTSIALRLVAGVFRR